MAAEITRTVDEVHPHLVHVRKYSWGGNSDHLEFWGECRACGEWFGHSDYHHDDEEFTHHASLTCARRIIARVFAGILTPIPFGSDDEPF